MSIVRVFFVILFITLTCGCAIVTDKGRLAEISKNDHVACQDNGSAILYVNNYKVKYWGGTNDYPSEYIDKYAERIKAKLESSACFTRVRITNVQLTTPPKDAFYLEFDSTNTISGHMPFFTDLLSLAIPMPYEYESTVKVVLLNNNIKNTFEITDRYKVGQWSLFIPLALFMDDATSYYRKKEADMIDATLIKMKNDGILKAKMI